MNVKQVIVIRKDLNMRRGKEISQGSHGSIAWLAVHTMKQTPISIIYGTVLFSVIGMVLMFFSLQWAIIYNTISGLFILLLFWLCKPRLTEEQTAWLKGSFTKVTLQVDNEAELLNVYKAAKNEGLITHLITDSGKTEFNGVPTHTVVAIGPHEASRIDKITGSLRLY